MKEQYSWEKMIPVDETCIAAKFLATIWNLLASSRPIDINYAKPEPKMTELLCYYLKRFQSESGLTGFWVNEEQDPFFDGESIRRIKKDITYYSNATRFRLELIFEFKKLSRASLATYRGRDGMRRFVDGNYATQKPLAIMVGVLLRGDHDEIILALNNSLSRVAIQNELQMVQDIAGRYIRNPSEAVQPTAKFDTEHRRPPDKAPPNGTTTIAHIFLLCNQ